MGSVVKKNIGTLNTLGDVYTLNTLGLRAKAAAAKSEKEQKAIAATQAAQAASLQTQTLEQPKVVASDNFMANKASQLSKLRLGMASTMSGAGLPPTASLAPANTLKTKMGA